jgi:hypothetical protein
MLVPTRWLENSENADEAQRRPDDQWHSETRA